MSCNIVSGIIVMFYFLCRLIITIEIKTFIYFSYIVSIIRVNGTMLVNNKIISNIIICVSLHYVFYLSYSY